MTDAEWQTIQFFKPYGSFDNFGEPLRMDYRLVSLLDIFRYVIGLKIKVHGAYEDGHSPTGYHKRNGVGMAIDFHIIADPYPVATWHKLDTMWWMGGLGIYPFWNNPGYHIDVGPAGRRWYGDKNGKGYKVNDGNKLWIRNQLSQA